MRRLFHILAVAIALAVAAAAQQPAVHPQGTATGKPTGELQPGEDWWNPRVSPDGPVVVLVSLPGQTAPVDRNGVLGGRSAVSTGSQGHKTPTGGFTILEKKKKHAGKLSDTLAPGAPIIVTDQPAVRKASRDFTILAD